MSSQDLPKPDFVKNMKLIGYSDQGGREDGVQVMVNKGHAFVGHMFSKGFSVIDVSDPRKPSAVNYIAAPANTWNIHLQTHDDLLLVIHAKDMFAAAEQFYDQRRELRGPQANDGIPADNRAAMNAQEELGWQSSFQRCHALLMQVAFPIAEDADIVALGNDVSTFGRTMCSASIRPSPASSAARSSRFTSSRTLPGQT